MLKQDFMNLNSKTGRKTIKKCKSKTDIGWGYQIRSYVLQPYRLVKDLRFNIEDTNPDACLNGNKPR